MTMFQAFILGVIQGITEFLPVSSSTHLVLVQQLFFNISEPDNAYILLLHFSTLGAVLLYFRKSICNLILAFIGFFSLKYRSYYFEYSGLLKAFIVSTIVTGIVGVFIKIFILKYLDSFVYAGYFLILTSVMLYSSDKLNGKLREPNFGGSFLIGIFQGLAALPGVSRSGASIFAGLKMGLTKESAASYSFIVSIPAIAGALFLELDNASLDRLLYNVDVYLIGMLSAFLVGLISISVMIRFIISAKLKIFALYCLIIGIIIIFSF